MSAMLSKIFDYQRFEGNRILSTLINESESRYDSLAGYGRVRLTDDQLDMVNAAGDAGVMPGKTGVGISRK
ncbi:MAG: hypothetical protein K6E33_05115 [Lachnospiraceae bacterium]|nr:hypothetical protein [Lachnospiraceae bacterium]